MTLALGGASVSVIGKARGMAKGQKMTTVKLPADLVQKAKIVAAAMKPKMTLIDYLADVIRRPVERDLAKVARGLMSEGDNEED